MNETVRTSYLNVTFQLRRKKEEQTSQQAPVNNRNQKYHIVTRVSSWQHKKHVTWYNLIFHFQSDSGNCATIAAKFCEVYSIPLVPCTPEMFPNCDHLCIVKYLFTMKCTPKMMTTKPKLLRINENSLEALYVFIEKHHQFELFPLNSFTCGGFCPICLSILSQQQFGCCPHTNNVKSSLQTRLCMTTLPLIHYKITDT